MINLRLTTLTLGLALALLSPLSARAQEVKALPVPAVEAEAIPALGAAPVVVELFSSQACVFCPKADRLFADLLRQENVIGLACHVDYFDVGQGSLAHDFCTQRQNFYSEAIASGPNYTPQMVINGAADVVGYKFAAVINEIKKASVSSVLILDLAETQAKGTYKVIVPHDKLPEGRNLKLWLALYDAPHDLIIAEGRNKGKKAVYYHIVSAIGATDKLEGEVFVTPPVQKGHAGFVLMLQDMDNGRIYAVAEKKLANS